MSYIKMADIVVLVLLVGCFTLKALGHNSTLDYIILGTAVGYGAIRIPRPKE